MQHRHRVEQHAQRTEQAPAAFLLEYRGLGHQDGLAQRAGDAAEQGPPAVVHRAAHHQDLVGARAQQLG